MFGVNPAGTSSWRLVHFWRADSRLFVCRVSAAQQRLVAYDLQDNIIHGRFLAELTQEVVSDLEVGDITPVATGCPAFPAATCC